ncbi:class IV adenylate cyclase [Candidatus Poribacteria bacterium]|nr:class IV adenylate cyclase [Candidatus Poribacteria bacterium]
MAKNLEFKGQFQSLNGLYPKLTDLNAIQHETVHQIDTYFHVTKVKDSLKSGVCEPRLKLREAKGWSEGWLIYYERPNQDGSRYSQYQLCEIADPGSLKSLLTLALGVKTIVKKQRELWMFNHTRIHLDTVADLGRFVELETVFRGQTDAEAIDEHQHVKAALHLDAVDPIAVSYSDLIMQKS